MNYRNLLKTKKDWIKFLVIISAYLLTFSRANILAMIVVVVISWKYIPKKQYIVGSIVLGLLGFIVLYAIQNDSGITHKIMNWFVASITFSESSAAGRTGIWKDAFSEVMNRPFGIGFGKVGSWAQTSGVVNFFHCENSYLAIALDLGWAGAIMYILLLFRQFCVTKKLKRYNSSIGMCNKMIISYLMICMFFSNHIYDMEAMMYCYTVVLMISGYAKYIMQEKKEVTYI